MKTFIFALVLRAKQPVIESGKKTLLHTNIPVEHLRPVLPKFYFKNRWERQSGNAHYKFHTIQKNICRLQHFTG